MPVYYPARSHATLEDVMLTDLVLNPLVRDIPRRDSALFPSIQRMIYGKLYTQRFRAFFLGMITATPEIPEDTKATFGQWLEPAWTELLCATSDRLHWDKHGDAQARGTERVLRSEMMRLFRCFQGGFRVTDRFVV